MRIVGVRELRQRASELLRHVEAGETFEITDRGRPVAVLAPLPEAGPLERLRAAGDVITASGALDSLPDPLPLPKGKQAPSVAVVRRRLHER